jgi:hypothetical protein
LTTITIKYFYIISKDSMNLRKADQKRILNLKTGAQKRYRDLLANLLLNTKKFQIDIEQNLGLKEPSLFDRVK